MNDTRPKGRLNINKDYYAGGLMLLIGAGAVYKGLDYTTGTLTEMGPGYFPVCVGTVLAAMGLLIMLGAGKSRPSAAEERQPPEWRGWICIVAGLIAFIALGHYFGLIPATFAAVFISALGDRQNSVKAAFLLALAMVVVGLVVFTWALQVQFPLFHWG